jgi:hypothetical protein
MVKNQPKNSVESHQTSKPDQSRWAYEDAKTVSGQSHEFSMDVWLCQSQWIFSRGLLVGRKTWSVIETALPRLFELRSFSLVGIALVPPKG